MNVFDDFDHRRFFARQPVGALSVYGCYLYPLRIFADDEESDLWSLTEVIQRVQVEAAEIIVTRGGGLFLRPSADLAKLEAEPARGPEARATLRRAMLSFKQEAARIFNLLICELALQGVVSEPASTAVTARGWLIDNRALIVSAEVGRETYAERTALTGMALANGYTAFPRWFNDHPPELLAAAEGLRRADRVAALSPVAPALVAGAYSLYSRRQLPEAIVDAWVVIEQFIDKAWGQHLAGISVKQRREKLGDGRSYTVAVRTEFLLELGALDPNLYTAVEKARKHRNALAHGATLSHQAARESVRALQDVLERLCGEPVAPPVLDSPT